MSTPKTKEAGSVAALADPVDAKPESPATRYNAIAKLRQSSISPGSAANTNISEATSLLEPGGLSSAPHGFISQEMTATDHMSSAMAAVASESGADWSQVLRLGQLGLIRYDEFIGSEVIQRNGNAVRLDEVEITRLLVDLEKLGYTKISPKRLTDLVRLFARQSSFDSAEDWLNQIPAWDRVRRVERFLPDYIGTALTPYHLAVSRYWWTAMVARILYPGCKADMVPVMVGPQGSRKTTLVKTLAPTPDHYGEASITDKGSDLTRKVQGKLVVEWSDMRGIKGSCDADEAKTFITRSFDEIRRASGTSMNRHERRFILVATTNRNDFLRDPTGHRRFLPFDVPGMIDTGKVEADRDQLWAEALHIVRDRIAHDMSPIDFEDAERLADDEHGAYIKEAPWVGDTALRRWLEGGVDRFTTEEALRHLDSWTGPPKSAKNDMATTLRQLGYTQKPTRVSGAKGSPRRWHRSPGLPCP